MQTRLREEPGSARPEQKVGRELASVVLDHERGYAGDSVMEGCRLSSMMAREHHQHDGLFVDPQYSSIIGDNGLPIAGFMYYANVAQISREAIVYLLHFHRVQQLFARSL